ncbi:hypothetical protein AAG570_011371 [Ranatra chinensis]|uniref:alanine--tRNA ligase n=1 Tax=Ranatra chinensis TaxID=642074 RepID=A0ABD0Z2M9_9HEMI
MDPVRPVALKKYCPVIKFLCRNKSRYLAAKDVRRRFVDFFLNENHNFIRSSSVKPYNDPSLEFVNAGMNQFKNVFLGIAPPPALRATNSQKCIRIGGKHNDLNTVGHDSYHHTFFEMLGNWSFGDYFKKESCEFAWNLLTSQPYSLEPDRLYTTYFGGDASLNLPPDNETKEIWEKIGVHKNRIIPFGLKDNFWEMGSSGPCGPCTELHYDHKGTVARPDCVNRDLQDLTELWNIVFIQYNRKEDGNLELLEQNFVDTGMGLERLTALLQGKNSNYDTDLFMPLFETISEVSGLQFYKGNFGPDDVDGLDTKYRILADHARMIAIAIADNVLPENSHGLRRVIRKSLIVSEQIMSRNQGVNESFVATNLLLEVIKQVSLVLHSAYPEMEFVLRNESNLWINLRESVKTEWKKLLTLDPNLEKLSDSQNQGLINACRELHSLGIYSGEKINRKMALTFYDRYGLSSQLIEELASIKGLKIDMDMLIKDIKDLKEINKAALMVSFKTSISGTSLLSSIKHCDLTDDSAKFQSRRGCNNEYVFDPFFGKVEAVFCNEKSLSVGDTIKWYDQIGILFDKTNFWSSNGDENDSDIGHITLIDSKSKNDIGCLLVDEVYNYSGFIIHYGKLLPIRKKYVDLESILFVI